jgi:hypothetical protein
MKLLRRALWLACLLPCVVLHAQQDTVFLSNGDVITGTIRGLDKAVLSVSAPYASGDIRIRWGGVVGLHTEKELLAVKEDGTRLRGRFMRGEPWELLFRVGVDTLRIPAPSVVRIVVVQDDPWSRLKVSIDLGYNYTQASDLQQLSLRGVTSYQAEAHRSQLNLNSVNSFQRDVDDIRRTEMDAGHRRLLPGRWFAGGDAVLLANTAQLIRLRSSYQLSMGNIFLLSNRLSATAWGGMAYTTEVYNSEAARRRGAEGLIGLEVHLFNMGDLSLLLSSKAFPSMGRSGRWRMDHRADVRYNLPRGIYVRVGGTVNYDSDPVEGAVETDYVLQTAIGWSY